MLNRSLSKLVVGCAICLAFVALTARIVSGKSAGKDSFIDKLGKGTLGRPQGLVATEHEFHFRKKRNAIVTTAELVASKSLAIPDPANPEVFTVLINGSPNSTVYDVTLIEDTTGLQVISDPTPNQNSMTITYFVRNTSENFRFSYSATLSNLESQVPTTQEIQTSISYYTAPQQIGLRTLTLSVCVQSVFNTIYTACDWCWCILIILVCFLLGIVLAFVAAILRVAVCRSDSHVLPQKVIPSKTKEPKSHQVIDRDVKTIVDVVILTNEKEIQYCLEVLEFREVLELEDRLEEEHQTMTHQIIQVIESENKLENHAMLSDDEDASPSSLCSINIFPPATYKSNDFEDLSKSVDEISQSDERMEEMEEWKDVLQEYPSDLSMTSLIQKRHRYDVIDETFLKSLKNLLQEFKREPSSGKKTGHLETMVRTSRREWLAGVVNNLLQDWIEIYLENIQKIQNETRSRGDAVAKIVDDLKKEKLIWEKLATQQFDILKTSKRQNLLTSQVHQELSEKLSKRHLLAKENFLVEHKKAQEDIVKEFAAAREKLPMVRRHRRGDVTGRIKKQTDDLRIELKRIRERKVKLDQVAFRYDDILSSLSSKTRKEIKKCKEFVAEMLLEAGVSETWLEEIFEEKSDELTRYYDEIDDAVTSLAPVSRLMTSQLHDPSSDLLLRVRGTQRAPSSGDEFSVSDQRNAQRLKLIFGKTGESIKTRYLEVVGNVKKKRKAVDDVRTGSDQAGIELELQTKLSIVSMDKVSKKEKKKANLRAKRHASIASRNNLQNILSNQLLVYFQKDKEESELSREHCALDDVIMTLLQLLTSSGKLTSRDCRRILEESRAQCEETKRKYDLERKRREDVLKRKIEQLLPGTKHSPSEIPSNYDGVITIGDVLRASDDVLSTSLRLVKEERSAAQELFETRREVAIELTRALLDQKVSSIGSLLTLTGTRFQELKESILLLLPAKSDEYVTKLCQAIFAGNDKKKSKSIAFNGVLLRKIKQLTLENQQRNGTMGSDITRILSQRNSNLQGKLDPFPVDHYNPGKRPKPLGRTATPDKMHYH